MSPSASVAVPSKATVTGAVPVAGVAVGADRRRLVVGDAPADEVHPVDVEQRAVGRAAGSRATKYSGPLVGRPVTGRRHVRVASASRRSAGTLAVPTRVRRPRRRGPRSVPPAAAEAARNRIAVMPVRLAGASDHQSPSSMKPMFWPPPAVSVVVSRLHAGVAAAGAAGDPAGGGEVLGLLVLGLQDSMARAGQRPGAAGAALVGVGGLEDGEDVRVGAVAGVASERLDGAGAAGVLLAAGGRARRGRAAPASCTSSQSIVPSSGSVTVDRVLDLVAEVEEAAVRRQLDGRPSGAVLPDRDRHVGRAVRPSGSVTVSWAV